MSVVTREEYEDAAQAIRQLVARLDKTEETMVGGLLALSTLAKIIQEISPDLVDQKLRDLRLVVQDAEMGRFEAKLAKEYRAQLTILEKAFGRSPPRQK